MKSRDRAGRFAQRVHASGDVTSAIEGLERHEVRLVMWAAELDLPKTPATDHLGPLRAYLREYHSAAKNFDDEEVLVRI